jgi:SsrA-binding protein
MRGTPGAMHANEIAKRVEREGMPIVPLRIYFNARRRAKIAIALGRGKKLRDKRESEKARATGTATSRG